MLATVVAVTASYLPSAVTKFLKVTLCREVCLKSLCKLLSCLSWQLLLS